MFISAATLLASAAFSSPTDLTSARALTQKMLGTVADAALSPVWKPDGSALFYSVEGTIFEVSTATGAKTPAVDPASLARRFDGTAPLIARFTVTENGDFIALAVGGNRFETVRTSGGELSEVEPAENPFALAPRKVGPRTHSRGGDGATKIYFINNTDETHRIEWITHANTRQPYATLKPGETHVQNTHAGHVFSGNGLAFAATREPGIAFLNSKPQQKKSDEWRGDAPEKWSAEFKDHNLWVKNSKNGKTIQLTTDGAKDWAYVPPARWSPNGRHVVVEKEKVGTRRTIDLVHAAPRGQLQPRTETISYAKPGDELDVRKPHLFDLQTGKEIALDDSLYSNPFYLRDYHWTPKGDRLFFLYNERGHQTLRLIAVQAATGKIAPLIEETSATFIDYNHKTHIHHLDETDEVIWMSERDGWNHLYLVQRGTGETQPITTGDWVVRGVDHVDAEKRQVWFRLAGYHPDQDPYYVHHARINFDGSGLTLLTAANGTHHVEFSPNRKFLTAAWSRVDQPPVHELRRASDGQLIAKLGQADAAKLLKVHPHLPEPFAAKGRDGETNIFGVIYRPSHFDPTATYPVVESIYAGPHGFHVPKDFKAYRGHQLLAEQGFIVVQIDGMGTSWRSKKFQDVCWKNLKDSGFPDRIAWMKAAAKKYPSMDLSRVGIHGGSAGGQSAMRALLDFPAFYKAAIADCGCHDNRVDKIWWNEAWMGWPVDESYAKSSNVDDAHKLQGHLLLAVGMLDSNVDPSSTMQVVDALIKADKDFELHAVPNGGHCVMDDRRRGAFFTRHLIDEAE